MTFVATPSPRAVMQQVRALPQRPGVYLMHDAREDVIYIGKATNLRSRVRSYFGSSRSLEAKVRALAEQVVTIDHIITATEAEALHLEASLVKRHQPTYNVRLKDDKHYPYLKVDVQNPWPRVTIARRVETDGARYFGPYASAGSVRSALDMVKKLFPWRSCTKAITGTDMRPCLDFYIKRCIAPCTAACTPEEYRDVIGQTVLFLEGRSSEVLDHAETLMREAAEELNFERAVRFRDQADAIRNITERQRMATTSPLDADVFALARDGDEACVQVFFVRGTQVADTDSFMLDGTQDARDSEVLSAFLAQFYESAIYVPRHVLLSAAPSDRDDLREMLRTRRDGAVDIRIPARGELRGLVAAAEENAQEALTTHHTRWLADRDKTHAALSTLQDELDLPAPPQRIECYDISTIQGTNTVASMVVFEDGAPATSEYRRFRIKTVEGQDDFASMKEVLTRRFTRAAREGLFPDLLVVDGGRGQLGVALDVLSELGLEDQAVVGLAKPRAERLRGETDAVDKILVPGVDELVRLPDNSPVLNLLRHLRDESHRFAIAFHRRSRRVSTLRSKLDGIPGVGPRRRKALLTHFGSMKKVAAASAEEIAGCPGIGPALAAEINKSLA